MNKTELVSSVAEKTGLSKKDTEIALNGFIETVKEELKAGGKVQLIGFGTFEVRDRAERLSTNPRDPHQEKFLVPASKNPAFKPGKTLKDAVNQ